MRSIARLFDLYRLLYRLFSRFLSDSIGRLQTIKQEKSLQTLGLQALIGLAWSFKAAGVE